MGEKEQITARVKQIKAQIEETKSEYDKENLLHKESNKENLKSLYFDIPKKVYLFCINDF